jgi:LacI family transcriptional regulator, repressor for deo operon, udp, cdd, tsx, nupC, and nupG
MSERVTMKDVAAVLGVSTATVSRALKNDPAISLATRRAVAAVAQRVQYRPHAAARRLRTKTTSLIGVVVQSVGDGYIGEVVLGIQGRARELGYQPLFFATEGRSDLESAALDVFLSEQVTELIAVSPTGKPELLQQAVAEGMHVAVINGDEAVPRQLFARVTHAVAPQDAGNLGMRQPDSRIRHIAFDDVRAGRLAVAHLTGLRHRSFVHLRGPDVSSSLLRLLGYRQALTEAGLWPQPVIEAGSPVMPSRQAAVAAFLASVRPPVAMVAYDDMSAVAALHAAHRAGWRVPEDLSVVGIDDIQFAGYTNPGLTTVAQPKYQLGALAVDAVLTPGTQAGPRVLDGELVIRESTAPAEAAAAQISAAEPTSVQAAPPSAVTKEVAAR